MGLTGIEAAGLLIGPNPAVGGLLIGGSRRQELSIPPDSNVIIDAATYADGRFVVDVRYIDSDGNPLVRAEPQDGTDDDTKEDSRMEEKP